MLVFKEQAKLIILSPFVPKWVTFNN